MSEDIYILGIESSCDETAAAVVKNGREVLSNIIASQVPIHRKYGGVVPEIASRNHIRNVLPVIDEALAKAQVPLEKINAVAVTYGPGLVGALLVGLSAGKALAWATVLSFWARPATTPPVKLSIKWRVFWGCLIPAGRR